MSDQKKSTDDPRCPVCNWRWSDHPGPIRMCKEIKMLMEERDAAYKHVAELGRERDQLKARIDAVCITGVSMREIMPDGSMGPELIPDPTEEQVQEWIRKYGATRDDTAQPLFTFPLGEIDDKGELNRCPLCKAIADPNCQVVLQEVRKDGTHHDATAIPCRQCGWYFSNRESHD